MSTLEVTVVTPDRTVWSGRAAQVVVPAADGSLGILPRMQPTLATLGSGDIRVIGEDGGVDVFPVAGGFMSMDEDIVTVGVDEVLASDPAGR